MSSSPGCCSRCAFLLCSCAPRPLLPGRPEWCSELFGDCTARSLPCSAACSQAGHERKSHAPRPTCRENLCVTSFFSKKIGGGVGYPASLLWGYPASAQLRCRCQGKVRRIRTYSDCQGGDSGDGETRDSGPAGSLPSHMNVAADVSACRRRPSS
jgi:hypothetical protein